MAHTHDVEVHNDSVVSRTPRELTREEHELYTGAVAYAYGLVPSFRDTLVLLRPFYDPNAQTLYVDQYARCGLGDYFFNLEEPVHRAFVVLHESMHILYRHHERGSIIGASNEIMNYAGDFEINTTLDNINNNGLPNGLLHPENDPFNFPRNESFENYYAMLANMVREQSSQGNPDGDSDGDSNSPSDSASDEENGQGGDGSGEGDSQDGSSSQGNSENTPQNGSASGSGGSNGSLSDGEPGQGSSGSQNGSQGDSQGGQGNSTDGDDSDAPGTKGKFGEKSVRCDPVGEEAEEAADEAGIDKVSKSDQEIAHKNTMTKIAEEQKSKSWGSGHNDAFLGKVLKDLAPPAVDWRTIFQKVVSSVSSSIVRGRSDYSYRRASRRFADSSFIMPGFVGYSPTAAFGLDTSGSMGSDDIAVSLREADAIIRRVFSGGSKLTFFTIDTKKSEVQKIRRVEDAELTGGGGTDMAPAFRFVRTMPKTKRPDVFILATDGYFDWDSVVHELKATQKMFTSIILLTNAEGYKTVVPQEAHRLAHIIDISPKNK